MNLSRSPGRKNRVSTPVGTVHRSVTGPRVLGSALDASAGGNDLVAHVRIFGGQVDDEALHGLGVQRNVVRILLVERVVGEYQRHTPSCGPPAGPCPPSGRDGGCVRCPGRRSRFPFPPIAKAQANTYRKIASVEFLDGAASAVTSAPGIICVGEFGRRHHEPDAPGHADLRRKVDTERATPPNVGLVSVGEHPDSHRPRPPRHRSHLLGLFVGGRARQKKATTIIGWRVMPPAHPRPTRQSVLLPIRRPRTRRPAPPGRRGLGRMKIVPAPTQATPERKPGAHDQVVRLFP